MRTLVVLAIFLTPHLARCATLEGEVHGPLGSAIPWVRVELASEGSSGAASVRHADKEGRFGFSWVPAGVYKLTLESMGFQTFTLTSIQLTEGQWKRLSPLMLAVDGTCHFPFVESYQLLPEQRLVGNLIGHVRQIDEGPPIPNAKVTLLCGERKACGETKTDSRGEFTFFNIQPGEYALRVTHYAYYPFDVGDHEVRGGFDQTDLPILLEHCRNGNCDPRLRPKRPLIVCE